MRDEFSPKVVEILKKRAAFICSNPSCRKMTVAAVENSNDKVSYMGRASHICAASPKGPRYDPNMTEEERSSIHNGIFLCANCADIIDDNVGQSFSKDLLRSWKIEHEEWVRKKLNQSMEGNITQPNIGVELKARRGSARPDLIAFEVEVVLNNLTSIPIKEFKIKAKIPKEILQTPSAYHHEVPGEMTPNHRVFEVDHKSYNHLIPIYKDEKKATMVVTCYIEEKHFFENEKTILDSLVEIKIMSENMEPKTITVTVKDLMTQFMSL